MARTGAVMAGNVSRCSAMPTGATATNPATRSGEPVTSGRAYPPLIDGRRRRGGRDRGRRGGPQPGGGPAARLGAAEAGQVEGDDVVAGGRQHVDGADLLPSGGGRRRRGNTLRPGPDAGREKTGRPVDLVPTTGRPYFLGGASAPDMASTSSGRRCPLTSIARTAESSSTSSAGANRTASAPLLSSMCAICVVPGMGTIQGFCAISHASATWAGVACFRLAQLLTRSTSARLWGRFSGEDRDST